MLRLIISLVKLIIGLAVVCVAASLGFKFYFTHVDLIAKHIRREVAVRALENHTHILTYSEIPKIYKHAVIATEDRRFYSNIGIDFRGIGRAIIVDLQANAPLQGGSTITEQLVHDTLLGNIQKSIRWKFIEIIDAVGLYDTMSKDETLSLYVSDIYYGQGAYGLYQAAMTYFSRPPWKLNDGELTMLAGRTRGTG